MLSDPYKNIYEPVSGEKKQFISADACLIGFHCIATLRLLVLVFNTEPISIVKRP